MADSTLRHRRRPLCTLGVLLLLTFVLGACAPGRTIEAAKVLADIAAGSGPSRLKATTPAPARTTIPGAAPGLILGDLYWPGDKADAALVLVPGAVPEGKDDPRLVAFAETFARARFALLVPEVPNLRSQQLSAEDARPIAAAIDHLVGCLSGEPSPAVGVAAISYAAGPALSAVLEPRRRDQVGFVLAIGGYYDLEAVVTFFTTGRFRTAPDRPWRFRTPNAYGKWVFVRANAPRLEDPGDRAILAEMAARKMDDLDAEVADLRARLGPEGRRVMALLDNRDPDRTPALIAELPAPIRKELRALDLKRQDLSKLDGRLILVHGRDDPIIPATESMALADAAATGRASLYVVDSLAHVELGPTGLLDGLKLWRAVYEVLSERDRMPPPEHARCAGRAGFPR